VGGEESCHGRRGGELPVGAEAACEFHGWEDRCLLFASLPVQSFAFFYGLSIYFGPMMFLSNSIFIGVGFLLFLL
jgi:hypothetical protein